MSASNWVSSREMSPDRDNRYRVDNMALQLRLGLPIELIGISGGDDILNFPGKYFADSLYCFSHILKNIFLFRD